MKCAYRPGASNRICHEEVPEFERNKTKRKKKRKKIKGVGGF